MFGRRKPMSKTENETPPAEASANPVEAAVLSPEQIEDLQSRAAKADENWERLLRTTADFENFKKRAARERTEAAQFANASLLQKLIPILDNFDMAQTAAQNAEVPQGGIASLQA